MQQVIKIATHKRNELVDITTEVNKIVSEANIETGFVNVYVQGATAGIM